MTDTTWPDFDDVIDPDAVPVPGSRPRVQHVKAEEVPATPADWDAYPKRLLVDGVETELFDAAALCRALDIKNETLKYLERKGYLPKTSIRLPTPRLRSGLYGTQVPGRRLYTRPFIEGVITIAREEGIFAKPGVDVGSTDFPQRTLDLYYTTMPGEPAA